MNTELKDLENLYIQYQAWCRANGLVAEFGAEFFDWMDKQ